MNRKFAFVSALILILISSAAGFSQTKCIWIEKYEGGEKVARIGISTALVRILAKPGSNCDLDDARVSFDTLL